MAIPRAQHWSLLSFAVGTSVSILTAFNIWNIIKFNAFPFVLAILFHIRSFQKWLKLALISLLNAVEPVVETKPILQDFQAHNGLFTNKKGLNSF